MSERNVVVGESITWPTGMSDQPRAAKGGCGGTNGRWACLTHQTSFRNNLEANSHTQDDPVNGEKEHVMAWLCPEHGVEAP